MVRRIKSTVANLLVALVIISSLIPLTASAARQVGSFTNFYVSISSLYENKISQGLRKDVTGKRGVVNLNGSATGSPSYVSTMRNSEGAFRRSVTLRKGERITFATPNALSNYLYWLHMRSSNATSATAAVSGSWSPDEN